MARRDGFLYDGDKIGDGRQMTAQIPVELKILVLIHCHAALVPSLDYVCFSQSANNHGSRYHLTDASLTM